jgi:hypothetical protein
MFQMNQAAWKSAQKVDPTLPAYSDANKQNVAIDAQAAIDYLTWIAENKFQFTGPLSDVQLLQVFGYWRAGNNGNDIYAQGILDCAAALQQGDFSKALQNYQQHPRNWQLIRQ